MPASGNKTSGYVCHTCKANIPEGKFAVYDDKKERYYCDEYCFETWAEDNYDELIDFYKRMNVSDVLL
jgi:hypothetical protein